MGRRIRYRPGSAIEPLAVGGRARENTLSISTIFITIGGVLLLVLVAIAGGGYLILQNRKFQQEFAPLVDVCQGKWAAGASTYAPTPGKHPAVAVRDSSKGWQLDTYFIPGKVVAQSLAETQVVVCVGKTQAVFMERCPYSMQSNTGIRKMIDRYYYKQEAKLIEAKTGRVVAVQTFMGNAPPSCHQTELFSKDDKVVTLLGSEVSESDVRSWASAQLYIE